jgi:hypothetical protein
MAVLFGSLITKCPKNRQLVSTHLPTLEPIAEMIEEFIEFQKALLEVDEKSLCIRGGHSKKILAMLDSMVQELRT